MKRLILLFIFSILFLSLLPSVSFAQDIPEEISLSPSNVPTPTPTPTIQKVEYTLPYPGLLPDNPLYFLKAGRDRLIEFLISDPAKKAEFYLLSSDKRLNTGYYLILKNKDDMGVLYISKSNNYMSLSLGQAGLAGERGKDVINTMKTAVKKHQEIIEDVLSQVDKKNRSKLTNEIQRLVKMQKLISKK